MHVQFRGRYTTWLPWRTILFCKHVIYDGHSVRCRLSRCFVTYVFHKSVTHNIFLEENKLFFFYVAYFGSFLIVSTLFSVCLLLQTIKRITETLSDFFVMLQRKREKIFSLQENTMSSPKRFECTQEYRERAIFSSACYVIAKYPPFRLCWLKIYL